MIPPPAAGGMTEYEYRAALVEYRRAADLLAKEALEYGHDYYAAAEATRVGVEILDRIYDLDNPVYE